MKRTTIKISEELDTKLRHLAAQRNGTLSEVIREALETYVNGGPPRRLLFVGAGASGDSSGIASRMEELLAEEWSEPRRS